MKKGKGYLKQYLENGKLFYEGEYSNGKKNGKGKEYNDNGQLLFEGEYLNNFYIKGRDYKKGRLEYEGEYLYIGKWNGKGYDEEGNKK